MSEVLLVSGVQLAAPFPAGLQSYLVFMAGRVERQQEGRRGEIADQISDRAGRCACLQSQRHGARPNSLRP